MSAKSLRKLVKSKIHKERAQPEYREHLGLLEKHKDYIIRAKEHHKKEDAIRALQEKAALRNPDEFYYGMIKNKMVDGSHIIDKAVKPSETKLKKMKLEDSNYISFKYDQEINKLDKLETELHFINKVRPKHTVFLDDEQDSFCVEEYFDTPIELIDNYTNRIKTSTLENAPVGLSNDETVNKILKEKKKAYKEVAARRERLEEIKKEKSKIDLERVLMVKGEKRKIVNEDGTEYYKWKTERKK